MSCYSIPQIQSLLRQAGWQENLIAKYSAIVMYESNGCVSASNRVGENSIGLLQINIGVHGTKYGTESQLRDPLFNLQQAYKLYKIQGDNAWFNSNKKYNNNFQGIAAQARNIYNQGGNTQNNNVPIIQPYQVPNILNNLPSVTPQAQDDNTPVYILAGLAVILLLRV